MLRSATATWRGGPGGGEGSVSTSSGVINNALYSFASGFGNEPCTNPGEMLAAAEASCMSLMFARELSKAGVRAENIQTKAELTIEEVNTMWTVTQVRLEVLVDSVDIDAEEFKGVAETAKARCPITRALNAKVLMDARFTPKTAHAAV
jgi:osmotically inducible protein OsmC